MAFIPHLSGDEKPPLFSQGDQPRGGHVGDRCNAQLSRPYFSSTLNRQGTNVQGTGCCTILVDEGGAAGARVRARGTTNEVVPGLTTSLEGP